MKSEIVFDFDKIIIIFPISLAKSERDACYGTIPHASFRPGCLEYLQKIRCEGAKIILHATENERLVKETLWVLHACCYFDEIIIDEENQLQA